MSDQNLNTLEQIQTQLYQLQLQQGIQERVLGCLLRGLARHPDVIDDVENEFHALADAMKQTNPELLDVVLPYIERLTKRE
ncbi:hypothetical protein [Rodentibacter myodis]|uniref:Uncharacterized protein n=1 Tax=Rodentibacter myodis TaxID=1907939 RepID=A0A1V3JR72_9PAST|nr:hypothetical protein [Rodentibacter myodis]OOF58903.1 hypothetical protein BKL49_05010 [Rodentibacter myodis]